MKRPRISLGTVGFLVLLCAVNFAVIRGAIFADGPEDWPMFPFFLLPMIDLLLVVGYRMRRRERRTPWAAGFFLTGLATTAMTLGSMAAAGEVAIQFLLLFLPILSVVERLALATVRSAGPTAVEIVDFFVAEVFFPMTVFSALPLLAALLGGWAMRRIAARRARAGSVA
jgi:hypothetical protein